PSLREAGAFVPWSCHIGADEPNEHTRAAWSFLLPYASKTHVQVFSRRAYMWEGLSSERVAVIPPCIDACSPKNQPMNDYNVNAILRASGFFAEQPSGTPRFRRNDFSVDTVRRRVDLTEEQPLPSAAPFVVQ